MLSLLVALLLVTPPQPPPPLSVYVVTTPEPEANGFARPIPKDVQDILQRIKKEFKKMRGLQVVESRAGADLVLKAMHRRWTSEETGVSGSAYQSASGRVIVAEAGPTYADWIVVEMALITQTVTHPLKVEASSGKKAAAAIAKDAVAWMNVNDRAIRAQRQ